ncbi:STAS domain-containing protein [Streptomyces sp. NPDC006743]|uniref:STAS domain-containing protein n=1 Tax=Streptomyces sp. NPDC006743 TaxID=3154480 RepID=UPI003451DB12
MRRGRARPPARHRAADEATPDAVPRNAACRTAAHRRADAHTCPELTHATALLPDDGHTLCLDLSGVPFMDSSGLNLLILLHQRLHTQQGRLALAGLQPQPARLLQRTGAYDLFTHDTTPPRQP